MTHDEMVEALLNTVEEADRTTLINICKAHLRNYYDSLTDQEIEELYENAFQSV